MYRINLEEGLTLVNRALDELDTISYPANEIDELLGAFLDTRGWIHFKLGNYEAAYEDLEEAISLTMGTEFEHAHLALVCNQLASLTENVVEQERLRLMAREQKALAMDMEKEGVWEGVSKLYWNAGEE